ncbi:uncharacterized protein LOC144152761 [Haemaphysalis longicornis]
MRRQQPTKQSMTSGHNTHEKSTRTKPGPRRASSRSSHRPTEGSPSLGPTGSVIPRPPEEPPSQPTPRNVVAPDNSAAQALLDERSEDRLRATLRALWGCTGVCCCVLLVLAVAIISLVIKGAQERQALLALLGTSHRQPPNSSSFNEPPGIHKQVVESLNTSSKLEDTNETTDGTILVLEL